jgi:5,10-methylene-tetrahydrofolate dehydrogenase/methenyl tetrahydrofolate cyclohydrolase
MTTKYIITTEAAQTIGNLLVQLPYKDAVKAVQALESIEPVKDTSNEEVEPLKGS